MFLLLILVNNWNPLGGLFVAVVKVHRVVFVCLYVYLFILYLVQQWHPFAGTKPEIMIFSLVGIHAVKWTISWSNQPARDVVLDMWAFPRVSLRLFSLWMHSATTGCFRVVICIYLLFQFGDFLNYKITFSLEQIFLSTLRWQDHEVPRPFTGNEEMQRSCKYSHNNVLTDWKNLISNTF